MTKQGIISVLAELNSQFTGKYNNPSPYPWLECDEIACIMLANSENVYPDETMQVRFDNTHEILYIRNGIYDEGVFVEDYKTAGINYELIMGIMMVQSEHRKSPYKFGSQV